MPSPVVILQNTPWWAFAVLGLLFVLGVQALRPRTITVWRLLAIPAVFIAWGLITLVTRSIGSPVLLLDWLAVGTGGLAIGWRTTRLDGVAFGGGGRLVTVPGSAFPLVRNLTIFVAKSCLAAAAAIVPAHRASLVSWDVAVSGLMAGYFVGWLLRFGSKYRGSGELETVTSRS